MTMKPFKTLDDMGDIAGKRVLVREDLNVPMADGKVTDDTRLRAAVATVDRACRSRRDGSGPRAFRAAEGPAPEMTLALVTKPFEAVLGRAVRYIDWEGDAEADGDAERRRCRASRKYALLRRAKRRTIPPWSNASRRWAISTSTTPFPPRTARMPRPRGWRTSCPHSPGGQMEAELDALDKALGAPEHPVAAVVGGAKVSTKLDVLKHLVDKVDHLIIGGGMANTFLAARGVDVGKRLCEHDLTGTAERDPRSGRQGGLHRPSAL